LPGILAILEMAVGKPTSLFLRTDERQAVGKQINKDTLCALVTSASRGMKQRQAQGGLGTPVL